MRAKWWTHHLRVSELPTEVSRLHHPDSRGMFGLFGFCSGFGPRVLTWVTWMW